MKKEPLGLYLLRFLMMAGLFGFMLMLYWSSSLVEERQKEIRSELTEIKQEIFELKESLGTFEGRVQFEPKAAVRRNGSLKRSKHVDPSLPNLLSKDPFYAETLPNLLGPDFAPHGTYHQATIGKPDDLHPFSNFAQVSSWIGLCSVSLAQMEFGKFETMAPNMALMIEAKKREDGTNEFWVHLRDDVYWQPLSENLFSEKINLATQFQKKHQVTAHDYKFRFDATMNPYNQEPGAVAARTYIGDIVEIEVIDDLTFVVRWKVHEFEGKPRIKYVAKQLTGGLQPLASFVYKYFADGTKILEDDSDPNTYRTNSVWAQNFKEHWAKNIIVSCGPWIFEGMTEREIRFRRNPDHFSPLDALMTKRVFAFKNSTDSIWQDFKTNQLETHILVPDQLIELDEFLQSDLYQEQAEEDAAVKRLDYVARQYSFIGWNMAKPYFESKKVRQALTMAIDRERIINQNMNGMGIETTGPFYIYSPAYDTSIKPWPFDLYRAKALLEEEGWYDSDGDGIIDKEIDGRRVPFRFNLTYYVKNPTTKSICEYVATALKEVGIDCQLNGVDIADLSAAIDGKTFDAIFMGWVLGTPPEDPRQLWSSAGAKEPGSSNMVGFANAETDEIIDKLTFEDDPEDRIKLYHRFHEIIHEEQPYTFLYTRKATLLYREFVQNVFIPADRQNLIPGANWGEPQSSIFWFKK